MTYKEMLQRCIICCEARGFFMWCDVIGDGEWTKRISWNLYCQLADDTMDYFGQSY